MTLNLMADIGGTNTRVALADGAALRTGSIRRYANAAFRDLSAVLEAYMAEAEIRRLDGACVAAAGPVRDGVARMTNLAWVIDRETLGQTTGADTLAILNDLQAQGHALGHLDPGALTCVIDAPAAGATAAKLVVGLGTGFNAAPVYDTGTGRFVPPSECGHVSLPVWDAASASIAEAVRRTHGFAAVEEVMSGRGLAALHHTLTGTKATSAEVIARLADGDTQAGATAEAFVRTLGAVVGDLALIHLPFGGIYLVGGMARAIAPYLERYGFARVMRAKGRFEGFLGQFAVWVVADDYAALTGCAAHLSALEAA